MPWPMRPMPRMPSVLPCTSVPANMSTLQRFQNPARRKRSLSAMRRAVASSRAKPKSAVVSVSTSGVLVPSTRCAVRAGTSKLLKPTAMLATMDNCGQAASSSALMRSLPVVSTPSLPRSRRASSAGDHTSSVVLASTSKCWRSRSSVSGNTRRATSTDGRSEVPGAVPVMVWAESDMAVARMVAWAVRLKRPADPLRTAGWRWAESRRPRRVRRSPGLRG